MTPFLKADKLAKTFENGAEKLTVLNAVDLEFQKGESAAIIGASGSGKSTLLAILAGLERPSEGQVTIFGRDMNALDESELSRLWGTKIGFIFQSYRLLPTLTALENASVPLELAKDRDARRVAGEWLEKVGLKDRMHHRPSQLSGGEQQRVALARALAADPEILFADEPTGNLDTKTGREMADLLFALVRERGATLILVTHESSLASRTGRVVELEAGRVIRDSAAKR